MADVILKLVIDGKEFDAKIKDADRQIGTLKKDMQKHSADMTSSLKGVASAMGLAFGAATVINFLKQSVEAYAEQEAALKKLEVALGRNASGLAQYASELQKSTAFGDETIIKGMAMLAMFTKNEDEIKKLTKATLDFAAAKEMDLVSAADLVAKTIGSEVNALGRYGIQVDGAVGSTERLNKTLEGLTKLFAGQAAAQLDTTSGKLKNMQNRIGDVSEAIGEKLIPMLTALLSKVDALLVLGDKISKNEFLMTLLKLGASPLFTGSGNKLDQQLERVRRMYEMQGAVVGKGNIYDTIDADNYIKNILFQVQTLGKILPIQKDLNKEKEKEVKTARELWDIREKQMKEEKEYWDDFYNEYMNATESSSSKSRAGGKPGDRASAPINEMSETMKQSMGVINDTTDAMWRNLIIGGRQAVDQWDAIWLAFRNSALQRIGEIVQSKIWDFLLDTFFSVVTGSPVGLPGSPASAVTSSPSGFAGGVANRPIKVIVESKIEGENIYLSNKRVAQRKSDNSL